MQISSHIEKIRKFEALMSRLDPLRDFELWFWAAMNAGTNAVNASLHHYGLTRDDDVFPTQPGVYLVPQANGELSLRHHKLGDILHVGRPKLSVPVPDDVAAMMTAMETIEQYRDPCVRDDREPTQAIVDECDEALRTCLSILEQQLGATRR